jgi:signal transduction histidine kinase/ActR/RegA family two-component response regulator
MMRLLEEKNKWIESLYLIAITNRGKDFFQRVAQALSDALGLNTLVLSYNPAGKSFHSAAFSGPDRDESCGDFAGLPGEQILAEKKPVIVSSDACRKFPSAACLSRAKAQTYAGIPVFDRGGVVTGTMNLFGKEKHLTQWDLNLIQTACRMVAVEFEYLAKEKDKARLEVQLQQAQKMEAIGTLAGGIAHDFNNILFPVLGHTEILLEDNPEGTPIHDRLKKIYKGSIRARDLVRQILTFSRQERFELKSMQLQPVIKEALKFIRSTIPATIDILQDISDDCSSVRADATQIHQIIMNLTANAVHAMDDAGGELNVSLAEIRMDRGDADHLDMDPGTYACLRVADTGTGMDNELIQKIFDPFFTTKEKGKGTGMGLSVVHGIVDGMNGSIQAFSQPGKGTEFKVYFPVEKRGEENQKIQTSEFIRGRGEKILLIDDEPDIVSMEGQMLDRLGYQVAVYTDSTRALNAFCKAPDTFDMIITDMAMPGMSGDRLAAECLKKRPDIPILLCTGFSDSLTEEKMLSQGIRGFLSKPMGMGELAQKIHEVLDTE